MPEFNLKFSNKFAVGSYIRAYDFRPAPGYSDYFLVGKVLETDACENGVAGYKVQIVSRTHGDMTSFASQHEIVLVPHEIFAMDYDERIQQVYFDGIDWNGQEVDTEAATPGEARDFLEQKYCEEKESDGEKHSDDAEVKLVGYVYDKNDEKQTVVTIEDGVEFDAARTLEDEHNTRWNML